MHFCLYNNSQNMSHQEKYTLTWHTYPDHLRDIMKAMMTSDSFTDVALISDD